MALSEKLFSGGHVTSARLNGRECFISWGWVGRRKRQFVHDDAEVVELDTFSYLGQVRRLEKSIMTAIARFIIYRGNMYPNYFQLQ